MRVLALILALIAPAAEAAPGRVVSASLCADQYVLSLAEQDQVAALSWQSRDPVSLAPDWAKELPQAAPNAETLLKLDPDLVVFGPGEGGRTQLLLERLGVATHEISWTEDFAGVEANIAALADALDREAAGAALNADLHQRQAALRRRAQARGGSPGMLYLTPAGGTAGAGTYADAAMRLAGGENLLSHRTGWFTAGPEAMVALDPGLLVVSYFRDGYASERDRRARHPAMQDLLAAERVEIPGGLWPCAGPRLIEAAERMADMLDAQAKGR